MDISKRDAMAVVQSHSEKMATRDIDLIMTDYAEDCVICVNFMDKPVVGHTELRKMFEIALDLLPADVVANVEMVRADFQGDYAFLMIKSEPKLPLAAESYTIRDGKVAFATAAFQFKED